MAKQSAGILLYRTNNTGFEVLLIHPGGPFWAKKDTGAWSIPKGEFTEDEQPLAAAKREFAEELGIPVPDGEYVELGMVKQSGGKVVYAWAVPGDFDPSALKSNTFTMEWPPKSGQEQAFPEVDRAAWMGLPKAETKLLKGQLPFLAVLTEKLGPLAQTPASPEQVSLF